MLAAPLMLTIYDEDRGFFGGDASLELGKAKVDLSPLLGRREMSLTLPLSWEGNNTLLAEGRISLTISWEMEVEDEPEVKAEVEVYADLSLEDQLAWELGIESIDALTGGGGAPSPSPPAQRTTEGGAPAVAVSSSLRSAASPKTVPAPTQLGGRVVVQSVVGSSREL